MGNKFRLVVRIVFEYKMPDPIEAIKSKMKDASLRNKDLVDKVGNKGYISSILSGRKPLTLELAKLFHRELNIPAEVLLS